jgi:phosphoserine phosphatase
MAQNNQDTLLIVSASISTWIFPWAIEQGFQSVLATELESEDGKLTQVNFAIRIAMALIKLIAC